MKLISWWHHRIKRNPLNFNEFRGFLFVSTVNPFSSSVNMPFYVTQKERQHLFHRSSVLVIGTTPTSLPKRFNIWFTLSRRKVCLPCSNSRTRRKPTPDFSESSTCVRLYCLRIAFTYFESVVCSIDAIYYTLSGTNIMKVPYFTPYRV